MKVIAFVASPRKNGNSDILAEQIIQLIPVRAATKTAG